MNEVLTLYYSPEYKITFDPVFGNSFRLWKFNSQSKDWEFIEDMYLRTFGDNWIKDLVLNGKVALEENKNG